MRTSLAGLGAAALLAGAASFGLITGTAQAAPGFIPEYHWCPGQDFDPAWGPNWDPGTCHDDFHRDRDGDFHGDDYHGGPPDFRGGPPPPDHAAPGNYYIPPGYTGPPPPPGGWQAPPFCVPFVTCPPT
ncbi:hypothetical protein MMAD_02160 [Mycolicibacterium madagascariense]|uniref:Pilin n=1 Tax=Mycolicibacterium madagascariense TaxID=212765 RepID=A0A7I7XBC8_9MYCO|nr:hypothetical protein MMAD_02160 [Mycolicibacterium madagascariense]